MPTRRGFIAAVAGLALARPSLAQTQQPLVVYDDELKNGWQSWSWAKVDLAVPVGGVKPIKVQGEPWSAGAAPRRLLHRRLHQADLPSTAAPRAARR
jgi:hypothetical protein